MQMNPLKDPTQFQPSLTWLRWHKLLRILLPLLILSAGIAGAVYVKNSGSEAQRKPPVKQTPLVQVISMERTMGRVRVSAMGTVIPAREVVLKSQVTGEVIATHPDFTDGGLIREGNEILCIDPADYELNVAQKERDVTTASYQLKLELGHQDVAKREWEILNGSQPAEPLDTELALRKPHLAKVKADLMAAEAQLQQARLDLGRTRVRAPFNVIVRSKNVEKGSQVAGLEQMAVLVGTDAYWVQVSVPVDRLKWINVSSTAKDQGALVKIVYAGEYKRKGKVIKLLSDLEPEGRLARLLVEVQDPLNLKSPDLQQPPLLIGEYVRVEIEGRELPDVFRIPRTALRDGANIWVITEDLRLDIRPVETIWRNNQTVFINKGLVDGERLIVSDLSAPVAGIELRIETPQSQQNLSVTEQFNPQENES